VEQLGRDCELLLRGCSLGSRLLLLG
jgi:hypothetical protein